jgi:hypothetical protein
MRVGHCACAHLVAAVLPGVAHRLIRSGFRSHSTITLSLKRYSYLLCSLCSTVCTALLCMCVSNRVCALTDDV